MVPIPIVQERVENPLDEQPHEEQQQEVLNDPPPPPPSPPAPEQPIEVLPLRRSQRERRPVNRDDYYTLWERRIQTCDVCQIQKIIVRQFLVICLINGLKL